MLKFKNPFLDLCSLFSFSISYFMDAIFFSLRIWIKCFIFFVFICKIILLSWLFCFLWIPPFSPIFICLCWFGAVYPCLSVRNRKLIEICVLSTACPLMGLTIEWSGYELDCFFFFIVCVDGARRPLRMLLFGHLFFFSEEIFIIIIFKS